MKRVKEGKVPKVDERYLEFRDGQWSDFSKVVLAAGDLGLEVLEGDGAVALSGDRHKPVLGHGDRGWCTKRGK